MALDHVVHRFGDIGGVVADALDILGAEQIVDAQRDGAGILHRIGEQLPEQRNIKRVDFLVALPDAQRIARVAVDEAVEHHGQLRDHQRRQVAQAPHQGALRVLAADRDNALADVLGEVADALEVAGNAQHGDQRPQIERHRLAQRNRRHGLFLDLPQHAVDGSIERDNAARQADVVPRQRVDRVGDLLLRQAAHLGDHLRQLAQVAVEDTLGVVGHIHDLIAAVGAGLAARCAHAIQPSAQSAFNALMILRFHA